MASSKGLKGIEKGTPQNKSNGPEAAKAKSLAVKATSGKGKGKQKKGQAESGAKAKYAKAMENLVF